MIKVPKKLRRFQMALLFSAIVFVIMLLTICVVVFGAFMLTKLELVSFQLVRGMPLLLFIASCMAVGTVIAAVMSRIALSPLRQVISAADRLAEGDFDARIELRGADELLQLTASFNHMAQELGSIELLRSDFVNNFSHEFKTPIVSIRGFAKMLCRDDLTRQERDEYLGIIISESDRLAALATNVLNLSKIENQSILTDKTVFNVSEQIRRIVAAMETRWAEKHIDVFFDSGEVYLEGNEELLSQVFINLLDNAIKFSPDYSEIEIRIRQTEDMTVFLFSDQGCGMSEETAARAFDRYYQGDTSHAAKGNGVGLALAKKITALHGGTVSIAKTGETGTTIEVRLPFGNKA